MYWDDGTGKSRLDRIRQAALAAVDKLRPTDRLAIVAFANGAKVVLPSTPASERSTIEDVLNRIDRFDIDQAGTTMHEGIALALGEVTGGPAGIRQLVILTDGETAGEGVCKELAASAAEQQVRFSVMGVGTEWNSSLVKELAKLSLAAAGITSMRRTPDEATRVFLTEFDRLTDTGFHRRGDVRQAGQGCEGQAHPASRAADCGDHDRLSPKSAWSERRRLGTLERSHPVKYIIDLSLPKRPDGKYVVAQVEIKYRAGSGQTESTGMVPLEMTYTEAGHGYVNAEVARHIDEVQIFELNTNLQQAIQTENAPEIQRVAEQIARKGDVLGPRAQKKTQLARQVLDELSGGGRVSKKTQLAVDDVARQADDFPRFEWNGKAASATVWRSRSPGAWRTGGNMVKCSFCGFENEDGLLYCDKCKTDLTVFALAGFRFDARWRCAAPRGPYPTIRRLVHEQEIIQTLPQFEKISAGGEQPGPSSARRHRINPPTLLKDRLRPPLTPGGRVAPAIGPASRRRGCRSVPTVPAQIPEAPAGRDPRREDRHAISDLSRPELSRPHRRKAGRHRLGEPGAG